MRILSFAAFAQTLLEELEIHLATEPSRSTELIADLGFDSMMYIAALGVMDQMGATVDDQAAAQAATLGDIYHLYSVGIVAGNDGMAVSP